MRQIKTSSKKFKQICNRGFQVKKRLQKKVNNILTDIREEGDKALTKYIKKFDNVKLSPKEIKVSESEISGAFQNINSNFATDLKAILQNVSKFYEERDYKDFKIRLKDGVRLGEIYRPIEKVGIYIPGGTAPLLSTVYMTVLPAKIAGVKEIVLMSPPNEHKSINPYILVVANLLKIKNVYKAGGAQAIGALAFGTKNVPKVDKIIGPGNEYVTEAKRQVYGYVNVDMIAGPSEVAVIANQNTDRNYLIQDLKAQSEHHKGLSILITTSKKQAKYIKRRVKDGYLIKVKNLNEATKVANKIAPEHLQIMVKSPSRLLRKINSAGAIFTGRYSPVSAGDYFAGPSHVLPTGGTARFFSALGVEDFLKRIHLVSCTKKSLKKYYKALEKITNIEGLKEHFESVRVRLDDRIEKSKEGN